MSWLVRRLLGVGVVLAIVAAVAVGIGARVDTAADDVRAAERLVEEAAVALDDGRLEQARAALDRAETALLEANESLRTSVLVDAARLVPGVRDNIRSLERSMDVAATAIHGGVNVLREAGPLQGPDGTLEVSVSGGEVPLAAVSEVQQQLDRLFDELLVADGPVESRYLLPSVADLQAAVHAEADQRLQQVEVLSRGLRLVEELAGGNGPRRYLLVVADTSEMRGSGGMILHYGVLEGESGAIDLAEFGPVSELALGSPVSADLAPDDYGRRWDGFDAFQRWRQANLAADFTVVAPVLEAMYTRATGQAVDGVIQIDPVGFAGILDGVGAVEVPRLGEVAADEVVDLTMHDAHARSPGLDESVLDDVAAAALTRLVDGEIPSLRTLAAGLARSVDGRHVLMHSTDTAIQREIEAFGADGALPPLDEADAVALTAQNLSGNKMDSFLDTALRLRGETSAGSPGSLEATVTLENTASPDTLESPYLAGPGPGADVAAGVVRSLVTLYLPFGTDLEQAGGDATVEPATSGTEAGRPYASFTIDVPPGQARTVTLSFTVPPRPEGAGDLVLVPTPRLRPTTVDVDIATDRGPIRGRRALERTWILRPGAEPVAPPAPAYRGAG